MFVGPKNPSSVLRLSGLCLGLCSALLGVCRDAQAKSPLDPAIGWQGGRIETGRSAALSDADTAVSSSMAALFSNPANMAASRVYHVGALAAIWPEASRQTYGAAIVDSSTSSTSVTGGVAAAWTQQDGDGIARRGSDLRLGLAFPFTDKFRAGATVKYLSFRQSGDGQLGASSVSAGLDGEPIVRDFGIDGGLTVQPARHFSIGLMGLNLNSPGNGFLPMLIGGGIGGGTDDFTIEADMLADFTTWTKTKFSAMGGGELLLADKFPLRIGYRWDQGTKLQWLSGGIGYIERSMGAELGLRRSVSGPGATAIVFSLTYHVESSGVGSTSSEPY